MNFFWSEPGSDFDSDWSDSESTKEAFEREINRLKVSKGFSILNLFFRQRKREQNEVITISSDENAGSDNLFDVRVLFILFSLQVKYRTILKRF